MHMCKVNRRRKKTLGEPQGKQLRYHHCLGNKTDKNCCFFFLMFSLLGRRGFGLRGWSSEEEEGEGDNPGENKAPMEKEGGGVQRDAKREKKRGTQWRADRVSSVRRPSRDDSYGSVPLSATTRSLTPLCWPGGGVRLTDACSLVKPGRWRFDHLAHVLIWNPLTEVFIRPASFFQKGWMEE